VAVAVAVAVGSAFHHPYLLHPLYSGFLFNWDPTPTFSKQKYLFSFISMSQKKNVI